jgi:hypothetical protein
MTDQTAWRGVDLRWTTPKGAAAAIIRWLALLLPCILAGILAGSVQLGSALALCFLPPLALIIHDLGTHWRKGRIILQLALVAGAILGVALEPGWLNVTMAWVLLVALAIEARSPGTHAPLQALSATIAAIIASPFWIALAASMAPVLLFMKIGSLRRIPFASLVLPILAAVVFAPLLAHANPEFERLLLSLDFADPIALLDRLFSLLISSETIVFVIALMMIWPVLRGTNTARTATAASDIKAPFWHATFFKPGAVVSTLVLLNLMFGIENAIDLQNLWLSPLEPGSYHHASYVHRGAYTLILTATLAGALMLTALRKGTATEASPTVRALVYVFVAQNLLLVASSVQRTLLYIADYGWTEWRVSGLIWMALVFFGIACIVWRVAKNRDSWWLINTNLIATVVLLVGVGLWNMQGFIAEQNVERELARDAARLDMNYVAGLASNALPALVRYESALINRNRPQTPVEAEWINQTEVRQVGGLIQSLETKRLERQADWRSWTLIHLR